MNDSCDTQQVVVSLSTQPVEAPRSTHIVGRQLIGLDVNEEKQSNARVSYVPVQIENKLCEFEKYSYDDHMIGNVPVQLNPSAWLRELHYENDAYLKSYLQHCVLMGFDIVDPETHIDSYNKNYKSVLAGPAHRYIDELVQKEIKAGKYVIQEQQEFL